MWDWKPAVRFGKIGLLIRWPSNNVSFCVKIYANAQFCHVTCTLVSCDLYNSVMWPVPFCHVTYAVSVVYSGSLACRGQFRCFKFDFTWSWCFPAKFQGATGVLGLVLYPLAPFTSWICCWISHVICKHWLYDLHNAVIQGLLCSCCKSILLVSKMLPTCFVSFTITLER